MNARFGALFCLVLCVVGAFSATPSSVSINKDLTIKQVNTMIDITNNLAEVVQSYDIVNEGSEPAAYFLVAIPASLASKLSYVQGFKDKTPLLTASATLDSTTGVPEGSVFYRINLVSPLAASKKTKINVVLSFIHVLTPFPAKIAQGGTQLLVFEGNHYTFAAYNSLKQSLSVRLGSERVESFTQLNPFDQKGDILEFGPYTDVSAFSESSLRIHYENGKPQVTVRKLIKEVEISQWGNIAVEEHYEIENTGAVLQGPFSRYDYQRLRAMPKDGSFRTITAILPVNAQDLYYRDQIGNISTSHVRQAKDFVQFDVDPRYPMFGGWKVDFYYGYNLPANDFLSVDAKRSNRFVLNVTFASPFPQVVVDEEELRIVLPEGASRIEWAAPFEVEELQRTTRISYLDTTGRPVLILRKRNLSHHHNQPFQVVYNFPRSLIFNEPLLLVAAFFVFFVMSMLYVRVEFSIVDDSRALVNSAAQEIIESLVDEEAKLIRVFESKSNDKAKIEELTAILNPKFSKLKKEYGLVASYASKLQSINADLKIAAGKVAKGQDDSELIELVERAKEFSAKLSAL